MKRKANLVFSIIQSNIKIAKIGDKYIYIYIFKFMIDSDQALQYSHSLER